MFLILSISRQSSDLCSIPCNAIWTQRQRQHLTSEKITQCLNDVRSCVGWISFLLARESRKDVHSGLGSRVNIKIAFIVLLEVDKEAFP